MNYHEQKLSKEEILQFSQFKNLSDAEIEELSDLIFDLAVTAKQIIISSENK